MEQTGPAAYATLAKTSSISTDVISVYLMPRIANHASKYLAPSSFDYLPFSFARSQVAAARRAGRSPRHGATDPEPSVRRHATALRRVRDRWTRSAIDAGLSSTGALARHTGGPDAGATRTLPMRAITDLSPGASTSPKQEARNALTSRASGRLEWWLPTKGDADS